MKLVKHYGETMSRLQVLLLITGLLALFFVCIPSGLHAAQSRPYIISYYGMEAGLSHNTVRSIGKDKYGFIWTVTGYGLSRFDGSNFTNYLPRNHEFVDIYGIREVYCDPSGDLWIRNLAARWSSKYSYLNDSFKIVAPAPFARNTPFRERDGSLWSHNHIELYKLTEPNEDTTEAVAKYVLDPQLIGSIFRMTELADGQLWIQAQKGLFYLQEYPDTLKTVKYMDGKIEKIIPWENKAWMLSNGKVLLTDLPVYKEDSSDRFVSGKVIELNRPEIRPDPGQWIQEIAWDGSKRLYFRTSQGIYFFDAHSGQLGTVYIPPEGTLENEEQSSQFAMMYDEDGLLWVGTSKGLLKISLGGENFTVYQPGISGGEANISPGMSSVLLDQSGQLWIGSMGNGLFMAKPDHKGIFRDFRQYINNPEDSFSLGGNAVNMLFEDSGGGLWVSGRDFLTGVQRIDQSGPEPRFHPTSIRHRGADMWEDASGLLISKENWSFCLVFNPESGKTYPFYPDTASTFYTQGIYCRKNDSCVYFMNNMGLYQLYGQILLSDDPEIDPVQLPVHGYPDLELPYAYPEKVEQLLEFYDNSGYFTVTLHEQFKDFWILNRKEGILNRYRQTRGSSALKHIKTYSPEHDLSSDYIYGIVSDRINRIWLPTNNGLTCIDAATDEIRYYYKEDGLPDNSFVYGDFQDKEGYLYFCTTNGLIAFHPDSITHRPAPPVYITGFRLFNALVKPGGHSPLDTAIMHTRQLSLSHDQNFISFDFSALDFNNASQVRYRYQMEGFDNGWIDAGKRRLADYPGMRPGHYTFRVIASNSNGIWNLDGASVDIIIYSPWWHTWWAFSLYGLFLLSLILLVRKYELSRSKLKTELRIERIEKEKSQEVDELKSRFLTNISHEFRTPLTLLLGPLEDGLRSGKDRIETDRSLLVIMRRNAVRLKRLIDQLLDISKLESGNMKVAVSPGDLAAFTREVAASFQQLAASKRIKYQVNLPEVQALSYFNPDMVEKVIFNLLSNAFKYTPLDGRVVISLKYETNENKTLPENATFKVSDTGRGIDGKHLDKIFNRYYQAESQNNQEDDSMGIGLALTRDLVELYRGQISVLSRKGNGAIFTILLPVSEKVFEEDERADTVRPELTMPERGLFSSSEMLRASDEPANESGREEPGVEILVVEDNDDLRHYMARILREKYQVYEARNGEEGINLAYAHIPDLVITDLMMPLRGGMSLSKELRDDLRTSHIPIIIITAKSDKESQMEGLEVGADDYMTKPFDSELLLARVKNLIAQRRKLRELFKVEFMAMPEEEAPPSEKDLLLKMIIDIFHNNVGNPDFNIESLSKQLHMSQAQIFRKVNALTGSSPIEFLRKMRLKKAASLFENGWNNVTEVMYEVGFNNHSYFAKCFREQYHLSPSEFKRR